MLRELKEVHNDQQHGSNSGGLGRDWTMLQQHPAGHDTAEARRDVQREIVFLSLVNYLFFIVVQYYLFLLLCNIDWIEDMFGPCKRKRSRQRPTAPSHRACTLLSIMDIPNWKHDSSLCLHTSSTDGSATDFLPKWSFSVLQQFLGMQCSDRFGAAVRNTSVWTRSSDLRLSKKYEHVHHSSVPFGVKQTSHHGPPQKRPREQAD